MYKKTEIEIEFSKFWILLRIQVIASSFWIAVLDLNGIFSLVSSRLAHHQQCRSFIHCSRIESIRPFKANKHVNSRTINPIIRIPDPLNNLNTFYSQYVVIILAVRHYLSCNILFISSRLPYHQQSMNYIIFFLLIREHRFEPSDRHSRLPQPVGLFWFP